MMLTTIIGKEIHLLCLKDGMMRVQNKSMGLADYESATET